MKPGAQLLDGIGALGGTLALFLLVPLADSVRGAVRPLPERPMPVTVVPWEMPREVPTPDRNMPEPPRQAAPGAEPEMPQALAVSRLELSLAMPVPAGADLSTWTRWPVVSTPSVESGWATEPDEAPQPLVQVPPVYPVGARYGRVEGYVRLGIRVSADGTVGEVDVLEESPAGVFAESARRAARSWRFRPARRNGQPVEAWVTQRLTFRMEDL